MNVFHIRTVLECDVPTWIAAGWIDSGERDHRPSVEHLIAVIEWAGEGEPPVVAESAR